MAVRYVLAGVLLLAGLGAFGAQAQSLPKIEEFYFDSDSAAAPLVAIQGEGDGLVDQLMKQRERGRKAIEATSQLASLAVAQGRGDLGRTLHQEAIAAGPASTVVGRSARWNYAWDLYRLGEPEAALEQWKMVQASMRGNPGWVPPTYALALWTLGRKAEAVQWYAAAVRTEPQLWRNADNYPQLLPTWREQDRAALAEVLQAWSADPPAWP